MRMGIQSKVSGFLILILAVAFGASTWWSTAQTGQLLEESGRRSEEALRSAAYDQARNVFASLLTGTEGSLERGEMGVFEGLLTELGEIRGVLEIGLADPAGKVRYSSRAENLQEPLAPEAFQKAVSGDGRVQEIVVGESFLLLRADRMEADCLRCHDQAHTGDLAGVLYVRYDLADLLRVEAEQSAFVVEARRRGIISGVVTGLAALAAASLGVFYWLGVLVRRPLVELIGRARDMASGEADLTARLPAKSRDEMGALARAFNAFVENLQGLVREVLETAEEVSRGSQEIQETSSGVLERATEQSDQTRAAATASEELSATVLQVSRSTHEAAKLANSTSETAEAGGRVVEEGVAGMARVETGVKAIADKVRELGKRSEAIGEVMEVIDDIADQTNLLALNAAIEAARAGEHGRGFSVVADEVRKLSEKTAQATRQVRDTVAAIRAETDEALASVQAGLEEVDRSGELSRQAGEALREVVTKIAKNSEMVAQVATASEQQSVSIEDVSRNIDSISGLAAEVASGVSQTSSTAERLAGATLRLRRLVGRFRV